MLVGTTFSVILGQLLKALRTTVTPLSQGDVATALNTSVMSISRLEKGTSELSVPDLEKLGHFFEIKPTQLFEIALKVKTILVEQKCLVLQNKHELKKLNDFEKIDNDLIYGLCVKFLNA